MWFELKLLDPESKAPYILLCMHYICKAVMLSYALKFHSVLSFSKEFHCLFLLCVSFFSVALDRVVFAFN